MKRIAFASILTLAASSALAETLSVELQKPSPITPGKQVPAGHSPSQGDIAWDSASFLRNGKPWLPVMGEIHFSRYPQSEWREELLKMKAGGITLVSTYIFWIHHEEERGKYTWDGDKDVRKFVELCKEVGLPVIVRVGPWCHGEVRNGGFPDWVQAMPRKRQNDPQYLAAVKPYYDEIGKQLKGLYWKENGPIMGIQFENEFKGAAAHLQTLKEYGLAAGMDVPIYTRTAWDNATNVPTFGEVVPLWGGYAEGFWDRSLESMPGSYWNVFQFMRDGLASNAMGSNPTAVVQAGGRPTQLAGYPYLTCELGGGMMSSYHRRIDISPMDVYSVALTKIGSGSNMPGYYMYHGGTNPEGKLSYLMEAQDPPQNMWNDMPVKNYDFGAILGACGEVRESYHLTRMLHMFLNDWGEQLARMPATYAGVARNKQDAETLRWAVRSDGKSGFLFVNNYQRAMEMPAKPDTQFAIKLAEGEVKFPAQGTVTVPANQSFFWPFNMEIGGAMLLSATAQPLCKVTDGKTTYAVFAKTGNVPATFEFAKGTVIDSVPARAGGVSGGRIVDAPTGVPIRTHTADGKNQVILLTSSDAGSNTFNGNVSAAYRPQNVWRSAVAGKLRLFIGNQNLMFDGDKITVDKPIGNSIDVIPPLDSITVDKGSISSDVSEGYMQHLRWQTPAFAGVLTLQPRSQALRPAGALRTISMGSQRVAAEPSDADFDNAAVWQITPTADAGKSILRLHYTGDVARIYLGDKFILDDFYNGKPLNLALWRYSKEELAKGLTVKILPLQRGAPIYMAKWPEFEGPSVARIDSVEFVEQRAITISAK